MEESLNNLDNITIKWLAKLNGLNFSRNDSIQRIRNVLYCYYSNQGHVPKGHIDWVQRIRHIRIPYSRDNIEQCVTMEPYRVPFMYKPLHPDDFHYTDIIQFARNLGINIKPQDNIVDITNYINDMLYYRTTYSV
jgi:hypothetical protein